VEKNPKNLLEKLNHNQLKFTPKEPGSKLGWIVF
jgi:hypothetical protein